MKQRLVGIFWGTINIASAFITLLAAYGGVFNPEYLYAIPAIAAMTFPICIVITIIIAVVDCVAKNKFVVLQILVVLISLNALYNICPLGFGAKEPVTDEEKNSKFSVITYNTFGFASFNDGYNNELTLKALLDSDADIICMQESSVNFESLRQRFKDSEDAMDMIDTLQSRYSYSMSDTYGYTIFSKFVVDSVLTPSLPGTTGSIKNYRLSVNGHKLSLYSIHLQSIGLSYTDKELYREITDGKARTADVSKVKAQILSKLKNAFEIRAAQARAVRAILDLDKTEAVLLCGDFNDITGCYAMRVIIGGGLLSDSYTDAGLGPAVTYRDNRFYFHIDHILYGGSLSITSSEVIYEGASDHLPLKAEFFFKSE